MAAPPVKYSDATIERICEQLAEGKSLVVICQAEGMPSRTAVHNWMAGSDDLAARIMHAREVGFHLRAERAVVAAKTAACPLKGRLAFDAERWYLGKLSNAFREKPLNVGVAVSVDIGDAFDAFAGALEVAAAGIAGRSTSTRPVVIEGSAGPGDAPGRLADLAGVRGERMGQDEGGK